MSRLFLVSLLLIISLINTAYASSIRQCRQSDGSILFTNKSCSIATRSFPNTFKKTFTGKKSYRKTPPFRKKSFIRLQKKMIYARSTDSMESHARTITNLTLSYTKDGHINKAYDMVASSYAKLSVYVKQKKIKSQSVEKSTIRIRRLFEEILISQPTISTITAFNQVVKTAWGNYYQKGSVD